MSGASSVPPSPRGRHLTARAAIAVVLLAGAVILAFEGRSIRSSGQEMKPGWERSTVLLVGRPAGWVSDRLGLADFKDAVTGWIDSGDELGSEAEGGFGTARAPAAGTASTAVVPLDAFDPAALGEQAVPPARLKKVLVTGDSMSMPLDAEIARAMSRSSAGIVTVRDPRVGTSISQSEIVDWGALATSQVKRERPGAVVVFLGANEGFPMRAGSREVSCCGRRWAAEYATRARRMMDTYRASGASRVYWLQLPLPRDGDRQQIVRSVNAAIEVAAQPYRAHVRVIDLAGVFTPAGRYRSSMRVSGREQLVREPDGVHLNGDGARIAAGVVLAAMRSDYGAAIPR